MISPGRNKTNLPKSIKDTLGKHTDVMDAAMNDVDRIHDQVNQWDHERREFNRDMAGAVFAALLFGFLWNLFFPRNANNPGARTVNWPILIALGVIGVVLVALL